MTDRLTMISRTRALAVALALASGTCFVDFSHFKAVKAAYEELAGVSLN